MRKTIIAIILMSLGLTVQAQRNDRGFDLKNMPAMVSKGQWMIGGSASYSMHKCDNFHFLIINDINSDGYHVSLSPVVSYAIRNNMSLGVRLMYSRGYLNMDSASLNISDISIDVKDYSVLSQKFSGMFIMRNYIPIGRSRRLSILAEIQLFGTRGYGKVIDGHDSSAVLGDYEKSYSAGISVCPGLIGFITDHLAFQVTVGMVGVQFNKTYQLQNQVYEGERNTAAFSFQINLLNMGVGLCYYFNDKR